MKKDKLMIELLNKKIKLLEDFILEAARIAEENNWSSSDEQMKRLDELSTELDNVVEEIKKLKEQS